MLKEGMFIQGRYEVVGRIGTGGMADVYKAKDHKLNRFVAVKVLKSEFREDKAFITKFRAEAQAAAGLAHPNIVNIYDVGEDRGVNYIVMELVEGITLKEYIAKKGRLAVREATSIAIQVSQGLEAAHNSGIIHRDVKPQNIIISTDGKVKVTDFGIARATSSNTINTTVMGSVHYSSPEQVRGGYSDTKSDIYSLGITMYEMLTGHVPFDGDTTVSIAIKHLQEEMKSPEVYVPNLPKSTVQIIYKCTQKSPDRRYAKMSELICDLKESLVNPDGNFVHIVNASNAGHTVKISRQEIGAIKEGYQAARKGAPEAGQGNTGPMYGGQPNTPYGGGQPNAPYGGQPNAPYGGGQPNAPYGAQPNGAYPGGQQRPYDPYTLGRAYGRYGYDYDAEQENSRDFEDDSEDDRGILNPRLEKIMTVGSIIIAVLIGIIFLALVANAVGLVRFSLPSFLHGNKTTEAQTEKETPAVHIQQTESPAAQPTEQETQPLQTEAPQTEAPQTEPKKTEAATEPLFQEENVSVTVPNVLNYDFETAQEMMMNAGFYVQRQDQENSGYAAGTVIEQSVTGEAAPGSTVILIVSAGGSGQGQGTWMCNASLDTVPGYNGELVRLELVQGDTTKVLVEGQSITFPYTLQTEGVPGMATGDVVMYVYNEQTGEYESFATYSSVPFEQVD